MALAQTVLDVDQIGENRYLESRRVSSDSRAASSRLMTGGEFIRFSALSHVGFFLFKVAVA
jgi:hypothetical protein